MSIARQLPFALALGVSRRSFYAGTALLARRRSPPSTGWR